ncbi:MAG: DUF3131 domain-containing protein [Bacteroidota bacterium]|nr:DUF3131 domain-containing protein [Candidatus Kapabacteria bacterium]MDW8220309.1 DUF3131 domain-containing protein [Bacteroidota bacterium]
MKPSVLRIILRYRYGRSARKRKSCCRATSRALHHSVQGTPPIATTLALCILLLCTISCGVAVRAVDEGAEKIGAAFQEGRRGRLTEEETMWAKVAWKYFENNYNPQSGLVNIKDGYQLVTMESVADYIIALMSARELDIISKHEFDSRLSLVFGFLNTMQLAFGELPNVNYNAVSMRPTDFANNEGVIGWAINHIGRLLVVLRLLRNRYPQYGEYADRVVLRWTFCNALDRHGNLYSAVNVNGKPERYLDAKHGWKEYTARGFKAWGFRADSSAVLDPVDIIRIFDVDLYIDGRDERETGSNNAISTVPYMYMALEFGWENIPYLAIDPRYYNQMQAVYEVQKRRHEREDIFTARATHEVNTEPYTVYDAIFSNGYKWTTISASGVYYPFLSAVSTKAAFGMWAIWKTEYTDMLMLITSLLFDPARGWYEGRQEKTGDVVRTITCSTNSAVLEALHFKKTGRLYVKANEENDLYNIYLRNNFDIIRRCFPVKPR